MLHDMGFTYHFKVYISQCRQILQLDFDITHFVVSIFVIMLMSSEIQKSKSRLRWVEVDLNPPQSTSIHYVVSIFVFMFMSSQIQKTKSGLTWVEVDLNPRQSTL